ncbi:type I secretion system permease/ATPase [Vibrio maerlii]|uniref:type I secretion system permease/ATPase n=1 Tax=Vibrio maerlii TaxID=2231648 RepID=UPI000E3D9FD3|nr:type I secretion system permease/ATPase [Vibrio maerlii]
MEGNEIKDPWMTSLMWLNDHFDVRMHQDKLLSGLPLSQGQLDQSLFLRAVERLSLSVVKIDRKNLAEAQFPVIVSLLDTGTPIVVTSHQTGTFRVIGSNGQSAEIADLSSQVEEFGWQIGCEAKLDARVEHVEKKKGHWLWSTVREVKPWYRDLLVASLMINVLALIVPLFTMNVYDRVVPNQAFNTLWVLVIGVSCVIVFDWLLREARSSVTDSAGQYIDNKLSSVLFSKVLGMKLENRPQSVGAFARQVQDFDSVRDFFTSITLVTLVDLPFTLLFLALIGWLGGAMMFVPVAVMFALLLLSLTMKGKIEQTQTESAQLSTQRQAQLFDCLSSLPEIKQGNAQGEMQKRWEQTSASLSNWQNRSRHYSNLVSHSIQSSQQIVTICLIVFGVYQISEGLLSMGGLIAIVMLSGRAAGSINQLSILMLRYQQTKTAVEGLTNIIELPQEDELGHQLSSGSFNGSVRFQDVSYQYPDSQTLSLNCIELNIRSGERVGVVGAAGSGKSTLLSLMAKQLSAEQGRVLFDDIDAQLWPSSVLRAKTGWVGQNSQLIYGSVIENITLGDKYIDQERITHAVNLSGLSGHMERLENGLETQVGEGGRFLSGGQRQSVAIARALYRQPNLLLMDEPTSSMDKVTETRLFNGLQSMPRDITMVITSHKPSFLALCDRIIVMDKGKIVGDGSPSEIFTSSSAKQGGRSRVRSISVVQGGQVAQSSQDVLGGQNE